MPGPLHEYLMNATRKAAADLEAAVLRIPEDKRSWNPMDKGRSALDQAAECAILNGNTAETISTRVFKMDGDFAAFQRAKVELAQDWNAVLSLLHKNTDRVIAAIQEVPDADLNSTIQMPWGPFLLSTIMGYPYWNMSYHEGQINYIASMLGCLD